MSSHPPAPRAVKRRGFNHVTDKFWENKAVVTLQCFEKHKSHSSRGSTQTKSPAKPPWEVSSGGWWHSGVQKRASGHTASTNQAQQRYCQVLHGFLTASEPNQQLRDRYLTICMRRCICESPYSGWVRTPPVPYLGVITLHEHVNH